MDAAEKKPLLVLLLLLTAPLAGVGIDLFVPSLPAIASQLATNANTVKFTIVCYLLGYAIGQPIFGTLSDAWGRKKPLFIGLILYVIISVLLALSRAHSHFLGRKKIHHRAPYRLTPETSTNNLKK
jgi:DHA1 family bicyclomycin/chloramphenicol resistance-like MFS transporter